MKTAFMRWPLHCGKGIVARQPEVALSGEVECDEIDVVAGHPGPPEAVKKKGDWAAADV